MEAGGDVWECMEQAVVSTAALGLVGGVISSGQLGLAKSPVCDQSAEHSQYVPLRLVSGDLQVDCSGSRPLTLTPAWVVGRGKKLRNWGLGGCFGFNFFYNPEQKPLSLGLSFFLDYIF